LAELDRVNNDRGIIQNKLGGAQANSAHLQRLLDEEDSNDKVNRDI